jgi:hypothetical protein
MIELWKEHYTPVKYSVSEEEIAKKFLASKFANFWRNGMKFEAAFYAFVSEDCRSHTWLTDSEMENILKIARASDKLEKGKEEK